MNDSSAASPADISEELAAKARKVKLAVFDVDGIFTDGHIHFTPEGLETKVFHARDGWGIKALQRAGIQVAIISGRKAPVVEMRMKALGVEHIFQGNDDKLPIFEGLLETLGISAENVAYSGDDIPDLPILQVCGLPISVADGHRHVKAAAAYVTPQDGGKAAVRDICEMILIAQGQLDA